MEYDSTMDTMKVGFFLPTYNNLEQLKKAISSILPLNVPIVIGVDGSNDGTIEWLIEQKIEYLTHTNHLNKGRAATRNLALSLDWDWIIFMDSDLEFIGDIQSYLNNPSHTHLYIGSIAYQNRDNNPWLWYCSTRGVNKSNGGLTSYESFSTGLCAIPKPLFLHLKGFDDQFKKYGGEDLEFGIRAHNQHTPFFKCNSLKAISFENKKLDTALTQLEEFGNTGLKIIQKKHPLYDQYKIKSKIPIILETIAKKIHPYFPKYFQAKLTHYLVYCAVKKGYYSNKI